MAERDDQGTFLQRAYALTNTSSARNLYDEWAESYDTDLHGLQHVSPQRTVEAIEDNLSGTQTSCTILDAGCGTGLVGDVLMRSKLAGHITLQGCDLSGGMIRVAGGKGIYKGLKIVDLSRSLPYGDASFDVVACCGTLTKGHVGPDVLQEFVRIVRPDGIIVATVHAEIWTSGGYAKKAESLHYKGLAHIVSVDDFEITEGSPSGGKMLVMRKRSQA